MLAFPRQKRGLRANEGVLRAVRVPLLVPLCSSSSRGTGTGRGRVRSARRGRRCNDRIITAVLGLLPLVFLLLILSPLALQRLPLMLLLMLLLRAQLLADEESLLVQERDPLAAAEHSRRRTRAVGLLRRRQRRRLRTHGSGTTTVNDDARARPRAESLGSSSDSGGRYSGHGVGGAAGAVGACCSRRR